jgi:hypothetical protein
MYLDHISSFTRNHHSFHIFLYGLNEENSPFTEKGRNINIFNKTHIEEKHFDIRTPEEESLKDILSMIILGPKINHFGL